MCVCGGGGWRRGKKEKKSCSLSVCPEIRSPVDFWVVREQPLSDTDVSQRNQKMESATPWIRFEMIEEKKRGVEKDEARRKRNIFFPLFLVSMKMKRPVFFRGKNKQQRIPCLCLPVHFCL